ncbi:ubiquitin family protein [Trichuris suis]|nr:ubiquitin family protein [Trichuris suis]
MSSEDSNSVSEKDQSPLTLHIINVSGKKATISVDSDAKIMNLKCAIERLWSVPLEEQTLIHNNEVLCDDCTVTDCGLNDGDTVLLVSKFNDSFMAQRAGSPVDVSLLRRLENEIFVAMMAMGKLMSKGEKEDNSLNDGKDTSPCAPIELTPITCYGPTLGRLLNSQLENVATKRRMKSLQDKLRKRKTKNSSSLPSRSSCSSKLTTITNDSLACGRCFGVTGRRLMWTDNIRIGGKLKRKAASERVSRCRCPIALSENFRKAVLATADSNVAATFLKHNRKMLAVPMDTKTLPLTSSLSAETHSKFCNSFECPQRLEKKRRCRAKVPFFVTDISTSVSQSPPILQPTDDASNTNKQKEWESNKAAACYKTTGLKGRCGRKLRNKKARWRAAQRRKLLFERLRRMDKAEELNKKHRRKKGEKDKERDG